MRGVGRVVTSLVNQRTRSIARYYSADLTGGNCFQQIVRCLNSNARAAYSWREQVVKDNARWACARFAVQAL